MAHDLTPGERERFDIVTACIAGDITNAEAANRLRLSIRQTQRLKREVEKDGEPGVVHGGKGRVSNRVTDEDKVSAIETFLKEEKHRDFGPTFAMEQLKKQKGIAIGLETLRALMIDKKLWQEHKRKGPGIHREWRERKAMYGEMIQFDGSYHDWFETGEEACLLGAIDDATGTIQGAFDDNEGVHAVFRFWWRYIECNGLPVAVYLDKFSTYKVNHKNAVDNSEMLTQFQRAMTELGIRVICANSPEAKGRIERLFGTLQDRLVKEMRLADIKDREAANRFLTETYMPAHNKRFFVSPRQEGDAHRPLTKEVSARLPSIFSIHSERQVNNDFTIQFKNQWYQLRKEQPVAVYPRDTVTIEERQGGSMYVRLKDTYLSFSRISKLERAVRPRVKSLSIKKDPSRPADQHPWRRAAKHAAEQAAAKKLRNGR